VIDIDIKYRFSHFYSGVNTATRFVIAEREALISMSTIFNTRQFRARNSQAIRIPSGMALPPKTELIVHREGDRIHSGAKGKKVTLPPKTGPFKRKKIGTIYKLKKELVP